MISKIEVWGDSILRDVVLDPATRRYSRLKEASCVALSSRALGIPAENHARFGMTSEKGRVVMEREIPAHAEGEAALIGFGGNDIDYDWRAVAADPHAEHLPHTRRNRFAKNHACDGMPCAVRAGGGAAAYDLAAHRRRYATTNGSAVISKGKRTFLFGWGMCSRSTALMPHTTDWWWNWRGNLDAAWWTCVHLFWRMATIVRIYVWTASIQTRRDMR